MTLDQILASVQPLAHDTPAATHQTEHELDLCRKRVERLVRRGASDKDIARAVAAMHRVDLSVDTIVR